jgi:hypothetical protein
MLPYWLQDLLDSPYVLGGFAAIAVVALIVYLLLRQPREFAAFGEGDDRVFVTRRAVRELIQRCCEQLGNVGSAQVRVRIRSDLLHTHIALRVRKSANLKGISGYLREQVTHALTENLGIQKIGEIEIVVVGILADRPEDE